jgi:uncharacterized phage protein (TIGR01671 family)
MRIIKFRAWDKISQTMKYPKKFEDIFPNDCPESLVGKLCVSELFDKDGDKSNISDVLQLDTYIPMEYIGYQDQDGKDIYEGDIISNGHHSEPTWGVVTYWDGAFRVDARIDSGLFNLVMTGQMHQGKVKVIGNIYENPAQLVRSSK